MYRCMDCGPCTSLHSQSCFMHVPEKWDGGEFVPNMLMDVKIPLDHHCSAVLKERVTVSSLKGFVKACSIMSRVIINFCASASRLIPL